MATSAAPSCFIIRPYSARDKAAVKKVLNEATMSTVHRFAVIAIRRDVVAQSVLIVAAAIFILVDLPLHYSLITFPGTVAFIYLAVWLVHKGKIWTTHADLDKIEHEYQSAEKTGFWVAEEKDSGMLVGTVAVIVKQDPDMREPPSSVAQIRRMAVSKGFQRRGIGKKLLDTAISHCHRCRFRAIELITTECHIEARNLYLKRGFEIFRSHPQEYLFGLISWQMYRYRISC